MSLRVTAGSLPSRAHPVFSLGASNPADTCVS